ncbi:MAG: hypothetical protein CM15mV93_040 [Caudoviricetes sp.]|nr:MAG: hypothetical protein CM15mV93_040 [Caudoviricetes sp.]
MNGCNILIIQKLITILHIGLIFTSGIIIQEVHTHMTNNTFLSGIYYAQFDKDDRPVEFINPRSSTYLHNRSFR